MHLHVLLLIISVVAYSSAKTGEEIADLLYQHPNECKDPSDGGIWAPLQGENPACGTKTCNFPQQWCSATSDPKSNQNAPNLNCVDLPPDCQKVLGGDTTTTGAQTSEATTTAPTTSTAAMTSPTTAASVPSTVATKKAAAPTAGPTAAPAPGGAGTSTSGCKDNNDYCCFWASRQQCDANPGWMRTNCQSSCGTCGCQASAFQSCKVKVNTAGCKWLSGGGGNKVRVVLGGGPGLAAMGFGNPGGQGGSGSSIVQLPIAGGSGFAGMPGFAPQGAAANTVQSRRVVIPVGGGPSPFGAFGAGGQMGTMGTNSMTGTAGGGQSSSVVTIPVGAGRKRRHFMPRWFNA